MTQSQLFLRPSYKLEIPAFADPAPEFQDMRDIVAGAGGFVWETENHILTYTPGHGRLIVGFDNIAAVKYDERKPWAHDLAVGQHWGCLGVMAKRSDWFRCTQLYDALETLKAVGFFTSYPAVSMYGASMGAYGAITFAGLAPGCTVVAMSPQSTISEEITPFETRYTRAKKYADWTRGSGPYVDAADGLPFAGKAYIFHDPKEPIDAAHIERLQGANAVHLRCPYFTHKLPPVFRKMGNLKQLALQALDGTLTELDFARMMRQRRQSPEYVDSLLTEAADRGHLALALRGVERAYEARPNWRMKRIRRGLRLRKKALAAE